MHIHIKEEMSIKDKARWITTTSTQKPSSSKAEQWVRLSDAQSDKKVLLDEVKEYGRQHEELTNDIERLEAKNTELIELIDETANKIEEDEKYRELWIKLYRKIKEHLK